MPKTLFSSDEFTPTEFSTAHDKAPFGNQFFRLIESEWKESILTKAFYNRLSNCLGHIAHYNQHGFYSTWFVDDAARLSFLRHTLAFPCYGDPSYTFSDVERAIKAELRRRPLVQRYEERVAAAVRTRELAQLERLQAKYGAPAPVCSSAVPHLETSSISLPPMVQSQSVPVQISLFSH